ncbi:MAG: L-lactate dehydrogenase [Cryomorphaceae bacterium]|jgi:L-lactate dehydrogenase
MNNSVGIIGMGWVGASVAISILYKGVCRELLVNDINQDIAEGEAMDLNHGTSFFPSADIRASSIAEMKDCDAIVITAGKGGSEGQSRLELLNDNLRIAKSISEELKEFKGILIVVANPVDVLTYFYQKFTGLPKNRVIGTGTFLDSARLREIIGVKLNLEPKTIHAQVVGEHGDSSVVLWSRATIGGIAIREWEGWRPEYEKEIEDEVRSAAQEIIQRKGATNHAIGLVTATLLKWILRGERRVVTLSMVQEKKSEFGPIALSLPVILSDAGIDKVLKINIDDQEEELLMESSHILRKAIDAGEHQPF